MKKKVVALATAAAITGAAFWAQQATYSVSRVIDGDTFETTEKQLVRLGGVNAPEIDYCGGSEAKAALEKLILGKKVFLKSVYLDNFRRMVSWVYTSQGFVNLKMIESGHAVYSTETNTILKAANDKNRLNKFGLFDSRCTQDVNPKNPKCNIKANIRVGKDDKTYHLPSCGQYTNTQVQLYVGDAWFCSENEAKAAGFVKGSDCFN